MKDRREGEKEDDKIGGGEVRRKIKRKGGRIDK